MRFYTINPRFITINRVKPKAALSFRVFVATLIALFVAASARAQQNVPLQTHYAGATYAANSLNWDMVQDARGVVYFANNDGVLIFDGSYWQLVRTPTPVRALALAGNYILVGGKEDFGILLPEANGSLAFKSFAKNVGLSSKSDFAQINEVYSDGKSAFFVADRGVIRAELQGGELANIKMITVGDNVVGSALIGPDLVLCLQEGGIVRLTGDKTAQHPLDSQLNGKGLYKAVSLPSGGLVVATLSDQLFRIGSGGGATVLTTLASGLLQQHRIYDLAVAPNGQLGVATLSGGAVVIDPASGAVVLEANTSTGLPDNDIYCIGATQDNNFFVGHGRGLTLLHLGLPIQSFFHQQGIKGKVNALAVFNGTLYAATTQGVFRQNGDEFQAVGGGLGGTECWTLLATDGKLLAGGNAGIYDLSGGTAQAVYTDFPVFRLSIGTGADRNIWFAGANCAGYLKPNGNKLEPQNYLKDINIETNSAVYSASGDIWVGTNYKGLLRIKNGGHPYFFNADNGLQNGRTVVYSHAGKIIVQTAKGYYAIEGNNTFTPLEALNNVTGNNGYELSITGDHIIFMADRGPISGTYKGNAVTVDSVSLINAFRQKPSAVYEAPGSGDVYLAFHDQIVRIKGTAFTPKTAAPILSRVLGQGDSLLQGIALLSDHAEGSVFDYGNNSLTFEIALPDFLLPEANQFQYLLEGQAKQWSNWQTDKRISFAKLREGDYVLHVRARNSLGVISPELVYKFSIRPPWYRTWWAFALFGVLGLGLIFIGFQLYVRRLRKANLRLERLVDERTQEIANKNEELTQQNEVIAEKNADLLDSINYARRIQEALLPSANMLMQRLASVMIFNKPRDIVSGDFYWAYVRKNQLLVAVADCTGHGVPGALMSVLGINFLSAIAIEAQTLEPSELLSELNNRLRASFRQDTATGRPLDGMDVALVNIDLETRVVKFAGAMRPLIVIQGGELQEYKGTKHAIGEESDLRFEQHEIQLYPDDYIFLFSDGYADQFGGDQDRKLTTKRFLPLLQDLVGLAPHIQNDILERTLKDWMGSRNQTDDIMILGLQMAKFMAVSR